MKVWFAFVSVIGLMVACRYSSSSESSPVPVERQQTLRLFADQVIVPAIDQFSIQARQFSEQAETFCEAPDASQLTRLREQWRELSQRWATVEIMNLGPLKDQRFVSRINFWPIRSERITAFLAAGALDPESVEAGGALVRGLPVLEYLLFAPTEEPPSPASFSGDHADACTYLRSVAIVLAKDGQSLQAAWSPSGDNFRQNLLDAGKADSKYDKQKEAFDELVNAIYQATLLVESAKLARPLGKRTQGVAKPEEVESPFARNSLARVKANIAAIGFALRGTEQEPVEHSVAALLLAKDATVWEDIAQILQDIESTIDAVPGDLYTAVELHPDRVELVFDKIKQLSYLLGADVAGVLGVTPTFGDNDGD